MKTVSITITALMAFTATAFGYANPQPGDSVKDVIEYARAHTEFPEQGFNKFNCTKCSTFENGVFIATIASCGTGACEYLMFEKTGPKFTFKSLVKLKPGAFQFLKTMHHGLPDIKFYHHMSATRGHIRTLEFDGKTYKGTVSEKNEKTMSADNIDKEIAPEDVKVSVIK